MDARDSGPTQDDFTALGLIPPEIVEWFAGPAGQLGPTLRQELSALMLVRRQDAALEWFKITHEPTPMADGHADYERDPEDVILTRVALYVPFLAGVSAPDGRTEVLYGALTYVIGNFNRPAERRKQAFMDIDDHAVPGRLAQPNQKTFWDRMMSVGKWVASDYPPGSPERAGRIPL